jgi:hypothetical protein
MHKSDNMDDADDDDDVERGIFLVIDISFGYRFKCK